MTLLLLLACTGGEVSDTGTAVVDDDPVVTWDNFGHALLVENCQPCHASTAPDRHDAPADVTFDTHDEAIALKDRILARATGDNPTMPPALHLTDRDRELLEVWIVRWDAR